ncbi:PREDICTED: pyridoxine-5'-phosphate oxidase-like isoform X2 [Dinoponera quadriceps]|uniref:pyridoxal 5'-phosphate synthase n=1 Tax=Dinoponera quadriceps TaxID=609295 RepID=A0A6P3XWZ5_DINQU|nr:PREDICTED: pyridoxine-5'-phosphate oxidase-like isoform X2 [Dinoponera quadriceps]XP_014482493.1 PREDICTED: pyridoxine-5'-phosphate oxidase-like isoform X2 [Dinoponera quadriceps]XP_014482494.1 PREDICTED: pyridoxine-5'-phosphate oxidase-like isoform X2 [Dinoponera quadriceps]
MSTKEGTDITDMRIKYKNKSEIFTEDQLVSKEPITQFKAWFEDACNNSQIEEPNAMMVGTATKDGAPSVRAVLLKKFSTEGFTFYTNYESRKGREIAENPRVALTFYWETLRRSIRIEGIAEKTSAEDSDRYFQSRPYGSQIAAAVSKQSRVIAGRDAFIEKEREVLERSSYVERPDHWGGYLVVPHTVEFWQGQSDRLHDRIRFRRPKENEEIDNILVHGGEDGWVYERLQP